MNYSYISQSHQLTITITSPVTVTTIGREETRLILAQVNSVREHPLNPQPSNGNLSSNDWIQQPYCQRVCVCNYMHNLVYNV